MNADLTNAGAGLMFSSIALLGGTAKSETIMKTEKIKTEIVTLSFEVELQYQNDSGREYLIASLKRDAHVDMGGAGVDTGPYGIKSVAGTARVTPNAEVSEGGTRDARIETAAQSRPSLH